MQPIRFRHARINYACDESKQDGKQGETSVVHKITRKLQRGYWLITKSKQIIGK